MGLRVVLDCQNIQLVALYALDCAVVGIELRDLQVRALDRTGQTAKLWF